MLNDYQTRRLIRHVRQNPKQTYAKVIKDFQLNCSHDTIARILKEYGIRKWIAKKRPLLTAEHAAARLKWCKEHVGWSIEQWKSIIWSDECLVEKGSGERREWVFRTPDQKWDKEMIQPYKKGRDTTVMVWAAFCGIRRSELLFMPGDPESKRGGSARRYTLKLWKKNYPLCGNQAFFLCKIMREYILHAW